MRRPTAAATQPVEAGAWHPAESAIDVALSERERHQETELVQDRSNPRDRSRALAVPRADQVTSRAFAAVSTLTEVMSRAFLAAVSEHQPQRFGSWRWPGDGSAPQYLVGRTWEVEPRRSRPLGDCSLSLLVTSQNRSYVN